jgi:hypothetical protein
MTLGDAESGQTRPNPKRQGGAAHESLRVATANWKTPHGFQNTDASGKTAGAGGEFAKQVMNWQTPATDSFRSRGGERKDEQGLDQQARLWRTPDSPGAGGSRNRKKSVGQGHQTTIAEQAEQWPTPEAHFNKRGPGFAATDSHYKAHDLATAADQWPTPNVPNGGRTSNKTNYRKNGSKQQRMLEAVARDVLIRSETAQWMTPHASDTRFGVTGKIKTRNSPLCEQASQCSLPAPATSQHGPGCSCSARMLNPPFVEMLMNVPIGFTDAGHPLASADFALWVTESSHWLQHMRTSASAKPSLLKAKTA